MNPPDLGARRDARMNYCTTRVATSSPGARSVAVDLEEGNELENRLPARTGTPLTRSSTDRFKAGMWTGIASRYVRVKLTSNTTGTFASVGLETSSQSV